MGHQAEKKQADETFSTVLSRIAAQSGRSPLALLAEMARLRLGRGRLSSQDYVAMRLFDQDWYGGVDKTAFVGFRQAQKIWMQANFRVDLYGLVNNKLTTDILFAAHGFPVLQTVAMFRERVGMETFFLKRNADELRDFLRSSQDYPLFAKPIAGHQSLGSASLERYDPERDCLIDTQGAVLTVDEFIVYAQAFAGSGYLFQRRASPHSSLRPLCGNRLTTVRVLTLLRRGQPTMLRACWKIPCGFNSADNFWRDGNLLAQLDLDSGRVLRVVQRVDRDFDEISHHPETGESFADLAVPNWSDVVGVALEAAKVIPELPLVGWDVAPVDDGAVLVEFNETPDLRLHQIADRRGILDSTLTEVLAERKREAAQGFKAAKRHNSGN